MYKFSTYLVKFVPRYFIIFDGIVFLISLSDSLLSMDRNVTDFCILILFPATLLNLLIFSNRFFFFLCVIFRDFYI